MTEAKNRTDALTLREFPHILEKGPTPYIAQEYATRLVNLAGPDLGEERRKQVESGKAYMDAQDSCRRFTEGTEMSIQMAEELLRGKEFDWWDIEEYRRKMAPLLSATSDGQFVAVMGAYALNRVIGKAGVWIANHKELFGPGENVFLDGLTNATVTNFGAGYPLQMVAAEAINTTSGGAQCPPYTPGPLMDVAAEALLSVAPIPRDGAKVAWFNSGGDAVSVGIAAAEKFTEKAHGENGRRKAIFFKEAYHGNIEGRAGRVTSGINQMFHHEDQNSIEMEFPDKIDGVEPALEGIRELIKRKKASCVVFESTQGDGGGITMQPDFFVELMKLSLDEQIPLIVDEVQTGFGRSGKFFDVEYLLERWRDSAYVTSGGYPENPPFIMAVAKNMTNGAVPGSAVIFPKEYAVLDRAQGLNTYSAHPQTLAATITTVDLMRPELLEMVARKRSVFDETIAPFVNPDGYIRGVRGHGLHLFLDVKDNQMVQIELLGKRRVLTGTVARNGLRIHAPINAPDIVWRSLAQTIGETAQEIERGHISNQTFTILHKGGPSGLAER